MGQLTRRYAGGGGVRTADKLGVVKAPGGQAFRVEHVLKPVVAPKAPPRKK
jgi:hypothetical protein